MQSYIVVGGGVLGASTAYHLAKQGALVTLIDKKHIGQATNAGAGIVCPWFSRRRNKGWRQLAMRGATYFPTLVDELQALGLTDIGYKQVGALSIHTDEDRLEQMAKRVIARKEDEPMIGTVKKLTGKEAQSYFPHIEKSYYAVYVSGAARVDGRALRRALIEGARHYGATYIHGGAQLLAEQDEIVGVQVNGQTLQADTVIVTAGAWATKLLQPLRVTSHIRPEKAQLLHIQMKNENVASWPVIMAPANHYVLSFDDGRIVAGVSSHKEAGFNNEIETGGLYTMLDRLFQFAPALARSTLSSVQVGFRPVTPDASPIAGCVPGYKNILIANGLGASGLTTGPYFGAQLAELAFTGKCDLHVPFFAVDKALQFDE